MLRIKSKFSSQNEVDKKKVSGYSAKHQSSVNINNNKKKSEFKAGYFYRIYFTILFYAQLKFPSKRKL